MFYLLYKLYNIKMERKLVKQGRNALTVTLPAQWLKHKGLSAGNSVFIEEHNKNLEIFADTKTSLKEITVDFKDRNRSYCYHILYTLYIEGYDKITILNSDIDIYSYFDSLIGFTIDKQKNKKYVLTNLIAKPTDDFNTLFHRILYILIELTESLKENKDSTQKIERRLDKNINFALRYLNKYVHIKRSYNYFLLLSSLEFVGDQISNLANFSVSKSKLEELINFIRDYVNYLLKKQPDKMYSLLKKYKIKYKCDNVVNTLFFMIREILNNYWRLHMQD